MLPSIVTIRHFLILLIVLVAPLVFPRGQAFASGGNAGETAAAFRFFSDKRGQKLEAKIASISDDLRLVNLVDRNGRSFELPITALSLDDQQFLREWLYPSTAGPSGEMKIFGFLPEEKSIDVDALKGIYDIVSFHAGKQGWFALRKSGEILTFEDRYPGLTDVRHFYLNTVWIYLTRNNGNVGGAKGGLHFPEQITNAVRCAGGNGHAAVVLEDGSVKVWGRLYGSREPIAAPKALANIVELASAQSRMTALDQDGRVYSWAAGKPQVHEAVFGEGAVAIEGSIFDHLVLTKSGEVYTWNTADLSKAKIPKILEGEGPFQKIRCNGVTRAAQREDGSWIAWGRNSSGIVDHINSLGPVDDLAFFSEPGKQEYGYVIWRE